MVPGGLCWVSLIFGERKGFSGHRGMMSRWIVGFCPVLGGQNRRFRSSSDGDAGGGASQRGMLSCRWTTAVPSSPQLKRQRIIPLFIKSLFKGNIEEIYLG